MNNSAEIQALESAYLALLRMPHGVTRLNSQPLLCGLRDALAVALGKIPKDVQDEYGVKALAVGPVASSALQQNQRIPCCCEPGSSCELVSGRLACERPAKPIASSAQTLEQDETPCPGCFQRGCNGECMGCGLMGG